MTLPRSAQLQWQEEIIRLWLVTADIPPDARTELIEMLGAVKREMEELQFGDHKD
jgi:hypothetical protein